MKRPKTRKLIEEEFWIKVYLAKIKNGSEHSSCIYFADLAVEELKHRYEL